MRKKKILLVKCLVVCLLLFSSISYAKPVIEWSPAKLDIEQMQGSQATYIATIQIAKNIQGVVARVVPELQPWVTVSPTSLGNLINGQYVDITINVNLSPDTAIGTLEGVVQLRQSVAGKPYNTIAKPLPITLTVTELVDNGLPPEPGEAGKQTLLGIDSDEDGVRDDIQRFIYFAYPDEEDVRLALLEVAKQYQLILLNADDLDAVFNNATKMARHGECLDFIKGEVASDILAELRAEILNTKDRSLAYIKYSDGLAGQIILGRPLADWKNSCAFDIDAIGGGQ